MKKILFAIALVVSLSACKKKANTGAYEKDLKELLGVMNVEGADKAKVSCPSDVEMKEGNKFICKVTIDKEEYKLETTIGPVDKDNNASIADRQWVDGKEPPLTGGEEAPSE